MSNTCSLNIIEFQWFAIITFLLLFYESKLKTFKPHRIFIILLITFKCNVLERSNYKLFFSPAMIPLLSSAIVSSPDWVVGRSSRTPPPGSGWRWSGSPRPSNVEFRPTPPIEFVEAIFQIKSEFFDYRLFRDKHKHRILGRMFYFLFLS